LLASKRRRRSSLGIGTSELGFGVINKFL